MGKLWHAGQIRPAGFFILAGRYLQKLKLPPSIEQKTFFPVEITDGSNFQKNKPLRCKIEMKNEVKTFYFGDDIRTWTVISKTKKKKRSSPCFSISVRPAASTVFPNLALRVKSLLTPAIDHVCLVTNASEHDCAMGLSVHPLLSSKH